VLLGFVLVVLSTEFGFRMVPGGRAPKGGPLLPQVAALAVAVAAGLVGGYVAARLAAIGPVLAAALVAVPLVLESAWLLAARTPPDQFWRDLAGACTLVASTVAGGLLRRAAAARVNPPPGLSSDPAPR
jgi:hypothetical protein